MRSHSRLLAKLGLTLVATFLSLTAAELIVRFSGMAPEVIPIFVSTDGGMCRRSDNHHLSFEMKPNYRNEHSDCKSDFPLINSDGLRDIERVSGSYPGVKRVVLLGDSVVVGFGVREIDDLMSRQLENLYPQGKLEVLNVAVTGYCTRSEIELLIQKGMAYHPDHVVLVFVENDFDNFNRQVRGMSGIPERARIVQSAYRTSHLFRLASIRWNLFSYGVEMDPLAWNHQAVGDNNVVEGLRVLRSLADEHGFDVTVAVWPTFTNDDITDKPKMFVSEKSKELIIEHLAFQHGFSVCRMSEHFHEYWTTHARGKNPRLHYTIGDEMHPSVEGHRVASLILKNALEGRGLREPPSSVTDGSSFQVAANAARVLGDEQPNYALDHMDLAKRLAEEGKIDEAIDQYQTVIRINEKYAVTAHHDIGLLLLSRDDLKGAIEHFRQSLKHKPDFHLAHTNLANTLLRQQKIDQALEHYRAAIAARPEYATAHNNLALALYANGQFHAAIEHFRQAAVYSARDTNFKVFGQALAKTHQTAEAIQQLTNAIKLNPGDGEAHFHLARSYGDVGNLQKSLEHFQSAKRIAPSQASVHNSLGVILMKMGRTKEAMIAFGEALRLDPGFELARRNLRNAERTVQFSN